MGGKTLKEKYYPSSLKGELCQGDSNWLKKDGGRKWTLDRGAHLTIVIGKKKVT